MTTDTDYPQAFPHGDPTHGGDIGMTLRDWFAGQALSEAISIIRAGWGRENPVGGFYESAGGMAYKFADAMLAERAKGSHNHDD